MQDRSRPSRLFGRDVELATLREGAVRAARGQAQVIVVEGEAGIGKSALAAAGVRVAREEGLEVLSAACDEMARGRPFAPLLAALGRDRGGGGRDGAGDGASSARSLLSAGTSERRHAAADAVAEDLRAAARHAPTLLVVEDLHWADTATRLALHAVAGAPAGDGDGPGGVPLALLLTTRAPATEVADRDLRRLTAANGRRLRLGPLPDAAVDALVTQLLGRAPGPTLRRLLDGARGNPLFVTELLHSLLDEGRITQVGDVLEVCGDVLPASFSEHVLDTVGDLDHDARGVLRLGALLGSRFSVTDLAAVSGRPAVALSGAVQAVLRAGLLAEHDDELAFRHELVRAVIYEALPQPVRAGVHREIAVKLAEGGAPPATVAEHFSRGAQPGDTEAIAWLQRGAAEVLLGTPETALELLERACELAGPGSPLRPQLDVERLEALGLCGRLSDTEELSAHLLRTAGDPQLRARVRRLRAAALLLLNRGAEAGDELSALADGMPDAESGRALAEAAICFLAAGDTVRADAMAARALETGGGGRAGVGHGLALGVLSRRASTRLQLHESLRLAQEAIAVAERGGDPDAHMYQPLFFAGLSLHDLDRLDDVADHVEAGRAVSAERGWGVAGASYCALAAFTHLRAGRLEAAAREAAAGIALGERLGSGLATLWCQALAALVALHRDDVDAAVTAVEAGEQALEDGPVLLGLDLFFLARALVEEATGQVEAAATALHDAWSMFTQMGLDNLAGAIAPDAVRLSVASGNAAAAAQVTAFLAGAAGRVDLPSWHGAAAVAQGLVAADRALLLRGVEHYRDSPRVLAAAQAVEHAGRALAEHGDLPGARRLLRQSLEAFEASGASRDCRRVTVALRAAGGRRRAAPGGPSGNGLSGLSPAEHQVAELVAAGLPNAEVAARLFISRRTVETHLYRIYGKLGVRSRVELAVLARRGS